MAADPELSKINYSVFDLEGELHEFESRHITGEYLPGCYCFSHHTRTWFVKQPYDGTYSWRPIETVEIPKAYRLMLLITT